MYLKTIPLCVVELFLILLWEVEDCERLPNAARAALNLTHIANGEDVLGGPLGCLP